MVGSTLYVLLPYLPGSLLTTSFAHTVKFFWPFLNLALVGTTLFFMSTVIVVLLGAGVYFSTSATITPHSPTIPFASNATVTPTLTVSPTATPSPTPTPQVIPINQIMICSCVSDSGNFNFSLIVRNATIDRPKVQVTLLIGLQNNSSNTTGTQLQFIRFQDQLTGETTDGVGEGFSSTQFTPNQLILFRPTFQFVPVAGHKYSLSAELAGTYDFSPITIKF